MNLLDLTSSQLKRAAAIKDEIEALNHELRSILNGSARPAAAKNKPSTRSTGRKNVAKPAMLSMKTSSKPAKKAFSAATRAKLSAKLKAYWAAKRAGKK
jgi:hypothetical protein